VTLGGDPPYLIALSRQLTQTSRSQGPYPTTLGQDSGTEIAAPLAEVMGVLPVYLSQKEERINNPRHLPPRVIEQAQILPDLVLGQLVKVESQHLDIADHDGQRPFEVMSRRVGEGIQLLVADLQLFHLLPKRDLGKLSIGDVPKNNQASDLTPFPDGQLRRAADIVQLFAVAVHSEINVLDEPLTEMLSQLRPSPYEA